MLYLFDFLMATISFIDFPVLSISFLKKYIEKVLIIFFTSYFIISYGIQGGHTMVKRLNIIWKFCASYDKIKDSREMKNKAFMDGCKTLIVPDKIFQDIMCISKIEQHILHACRFYLISSTYLWRRSFNESLCFTRFLVGDLSCILRDWIT